MEKKVRSFEEIVDIVKKEGYDEFDGMAIFALKNNACMVQCITNRGGFDTRIKLVRAMKDLMKNQLAEENMMDELLTSKGIMKTAAFEEIDPKDDEKKEDKGGNVDFEDFLKGIMQAAKDLLIKDDEP